MLAEAPLPRRKLYEEIVERIEGMVARGELQPGDSLPAEKEITAQFGVGRAVVREAFVALQRRGLITISGGERARISRPSADHLVNEMTGAVRLMLAEPGGLEQLQDARVLFEVALVRRAAQHATELDIARLREALAANRGAICAPEAFASTDVAFHLAIAEMAGNPIFIAIHRAMTGWLREQRTTGLRVQGADRSALRCHRRIFEAIRAHDPDAADAAMAEHLFEVAAYYARGRDEPEPPVAHRGQAPDGEP